MRVLFTCFTGYGIVHPLVPLARALVGAGHDVAFATGGGFGPWVERLGFTAFRAGLDGTQFVDELRRRFPGLPDSLAPEERLRFYLTREVATLAAPAMLTDLVPLLRQWAPDLLVHEMSELAGPVAAAAAGIPSVNHSSSLLYPMEHWRMTGEALAPLWQRCGLSPDPLGGAFRHLYLDICPPSLQDPGITQIPVARPLRPVPVHVPLDGSRPVVGGAPPWVAALAAAPTVYVTLGTVFHHAPGVLGAIVAGLRDEPVNVVAAVGHDFDPAALGPQPANVHIARHVPQAVVLSHCRAVVCHAGAGTLLAALSHGVPVLGVPVGIDQFHNARRAVAAGVARVLPASEISPEAVGQEVGALLDDPRYRRRAALVRREIEDMPGPDAAVGLLEELAARRTSPRGGVPLIAGVGDGRSACAAADHDLRLAGGLAPGLAEPDAPLRAGAVPGPAHALASAFAVVCAEMGAASPTALELAFLSAFLAPAAVPLDLLAGGATHLPPHLAAACTDEGALAGVVDEACRYSLVGRADGGLTMSAAIQAAVRDHLSPGERRWWAGAALGVVAGALAPWSGRPCPHWDRLAPHADAVTARAEAVLDRPDVLAWTLALVAGQHHVRGRLGDARVALERSVALTEATYRSDHPVLAARLNDFALVWRHLGQPALAREILERAVTVARAGRDDAALESGLTNLALVCRDLGDMGAAEDALVCLEDGSRPVAC